MFPTTSREEGSSCDVISGSHPGGLRLVFNRRCSRTFVSRVTGHLEWNKRLTSSRLNYINASKKWSIPGLAIRRHHELRPATLTIRPSPCWGRECSTALPGSRGRRPFSSGWRYKLAIGVDSLSRHSPSLSEREQRRHRDGVQGQRLARSAQALLVRERAAYQQTRVPTTQRQPVRQGHAKVGFLEALCLTSTPIPTGKRAHNQPF